MTERALHFADAEFEKEIGGLVDEAKYVGRGKEIITGQHANVNPLPSTITMVKQETTKLDKLATASAEAAMAQYEAAAKAVESMGKDVTDRITKLQAALDECTRDLKLISDAANAVRDKGKAVREAIEEANSLSKGIRDTCDDFRKKVALV
jgi:uncharacterized coiled-coil DUF342 family protein